MGWDWMNLRLVGGKEHLAVLIPQGIKDPFKILASRITTLTTIPECDIPVPGILHFFMVSQSESKKFGTEKISESVWEKFGTGKKSRNRYWKNLVPELIFVAKI